MLTDPVHAAAGPTRGAATPAPRRETQLESALARLLSRVCPGVDSGNVLADAEEAIRCLPVPPANEPTFTGNSAGQMPAGYTLVMVPLLQRADEPDWDQCWRQVEAATGVSIEPPAMNVLVREVRRWLAGRTRLSEAGPSGSALGPAPLLSAALQLTAAELEWLIAGHAQAETDLRARGDGYISRAAPGDKTAASWAGDLFDQADASRLRADGLAALLVDVVAQGRR